ncbi:RNA polymerase sigma factor [Caldimonas thermodepolymerans]|uniref:RNA polymerase ECF family sigma subunit n=1 Tax=Caldimonas thermodepolymerans TaxID=215580 RepID=A0A2S5T7L3_9BURK|nr:RNA polymerase sigma factor [Caldimonas thermodepolymerans]PPE70912.1 RNA polymerase subunit sigma-24 [Caldimonas thermodepolymerans]QPC33135.1 RNA polymerase sigma factor [Caldimonas thermodepolymerans]RDI03927.1 RNA polymerase ECF family sigma subunit [Caldimonas thermodepolymerans]TCP09898.1 RNA polymerase ECF family sigma subunit [Caldimonas thermodepolymerans]UZG46008.1 RNA polymerase sigma factor [Caldimonas thermodepolymerans]
MPTPTHRAIEAVWRIEAAKIIAGVARLVRDVGLAEELAQDALVAALEHWPRTGVPDNPGAWLMTTAKHRALDHLRRDKLLADKHQQIGHELEAMEALVVPDFVDALDEARADQIGDDLLRLIFTACHPVLSTDARVALTLRLLGGLTTAEIARAFLVPEPTVAQRIVRAKRTLTAARVPFELPQGAALHERLESVLEVIYLIFNEGYTATAGDDWMRLDLCNEALRLGRVLAGLAPEEGEVHGLVALMELQASRHAARVDAAGRPVLLLEQDRSRWDRLLIRRGLAALERAESLGPLGPYGLQAAIAACHARAQAPEETDWHTIVALYDALAQVAPSPVVELNRAVAVSMAFGPAAALEIVDRMRGERALQNYQWLPSVRGDLLARLGRTDEARAEFEQAAALARNQRERELLLARAQALAAPPGPRG